MSTPRSVKLHQRRLSLTDNLVKVLRGKGDDVACAHASHKGRGEERQEG